MLKKKENSKLAALTRSTALRAAIACNRIFRSRAPAAHSHDAISARLIALPHLFIARRAPPRFCMRISPL